MHCLYTHAHVNDTNIILNATKFRQSEKGTANYTMSPYNFDMSLLTLAHNRRKIGPEFRSIQRAAITLGIARHSSIKNSLLSLVRWLPV